MSLPSVYTNIKFYHPSSLPAHLRLALYQGNKFCNKKRRICLGPLVVITQYVQ